MTDFVRDLELELLGAAHRRATRRPRPRVPWRPIVAVAAVAATIAAAVAFVSRPQSPHPLLPAKPPEKTAGFAIAAAMQARACQPVRAVGRDPAPEDVLRYLGVLHQKPHALPADVRAALPTGDDAGRFARRVGDLRVVPTSDLLTEPCGRRRLRSGACLVTLERQWACFTLGQIQAGRAFALAGRSRLIGLVPDGPRIVRVNGRRLPVHQNVVDASTALRPDDRIITLLEHRDWSVLVLNATSLTGLASATRDELELKLGVLADAGNSPRKTRTNAVYYATQAEADKAHAIAQALEIRTVAPMPKALKLNYAIVVELGRMR
jgi:hypothetical protein